MGVSACEYLLIATHLFFSLVADIPDMAWGIRTIRKYVNKFVAVLLFIFLNHTQEQSEIRLGYMV